MKPWKTRLVHRQSLDCEMRNAVFRQFQSDAWIKEENDDEKGEAHCPRGRP